MITELCTSFGLRTDNPAAGVGCPRRIPLGPKHFGRGSDDGSHFCTVGFTLPPGIAVAAAMYNGCPLPTPLSVLLLPSHIIGLVTGHSVTIFRSRKTCDSSVRWPKLRGCVQGTV